MADKARISISKFVIEHVENSLRQEQEKSGFASRAELLKQLSAKEEEISKLQQDNRLLKLLSENLVKELRKLRARPFGEKANFEGIREYDGDLIELLRTNGRIDSGSLLGELGINPKEVELVKAIKKQLRNLQA